MPLQRWGAEFENKVSPGAREAAEDLRALKTAASEASAELQQLGSAGGGLGTGGLSRAAFAGGASGGPGQTIGQGMTAKSPWEHFAGAGGKGRAQALLDGGGGASSASSIEKATKASAGLKGGLGQAAAAGSMAKTAVMGLAAAAGVAGGASLFKLAMGWTGMAKLQAITARAGINMRLLFKGVDATPVLRAADRLSQNLSKSTVTGNALSGILTRGFNGFFSLLEKGEPYLTAMGQGALIAGLYIENGFLRGRMALYPFTTALADTVSAEDALEVASAAGGIALVALAGYAASTALAFAPLVAAVTAVSAAIQQFSKLKGVWDENSFGSMQKQWWRTTGQLSDADEEKRIQANAAANAPRDPREEAAARARRAAWNKENGLADPGESALAGQTSGKALGDGLLKGMSDSEAAVKAAGGKLADAANQGVRDKAQIRSPSRVMRQNGRYEGQGVALGIYDEAGNVQRAAESSLVPDLGGASGARLNIGGGAAGGIVIQSVKVDAHFPNMVSGKPSDLVAALLDAAPQLAQAIFRELSDALGIPTQAAA